MHWKFLIAIELSVIEYEEHCYCFFYILGAMMERCCVFSLTARKLCQDLVIKLLRYKITMERCHFSDFRSGMHLSFYPLILQFAEVKHFE